MHQWFSQWSHDRQPYWSSKLRVIEPMLPTLFPSCCCCIRMHPMCSSSGGGGSTWFFQSIERMYVRSLAFHSQFHLFCRPLAHRPRTSEKCSRPLFWPTGMKRRMDLCEWMGWLFSFPFSSSIWMDKRTTDCLCFLPGSLFRSLFVVFLFDSGSNWRREKRKIFSLVLLEDIGEHFPLLTIVLSHDKFFLFNCYVQTWPS